MQEGNNPEASSSFPVMLAKFKFTVASLQDTTDVELSSNHSIAMLKYPSLYKSDPSNSKFYRAFAKTKTVPLQPKTFPKRIHIVERHTLQLANSMLLKGYISSKSLTLKDTCYNLKNMGISAMLLNNYVTVQ